MSKKNILLLGLIMCNGAMYAQNIEQTTNFLQSFITNEFKQTPDDKKWLLKANNLQFSMEGLDKSLEILQENLDKGNISKEEQKKVRSEFVQSYIDRTVLFAYLYPMLLENENLQILLLDFLRQATGQIWLEKLASENPNAFKPTDADINAYYQQNSERLLRLGLSVSQIREYAEQELKQTLIQEWTGNQIIEFQKTNQFEISPSVKKKYDIQ